jgi:hypothetical protein
MINGGLDLNVPAEQMVDFFSNQEVIQKSFSQPDPKLDLTSSTCMHPSMDLTLSTYPCNQGNSANQELMINTNHHYTDATKFNDLDMTPLSDRKRRKDLANQMIPTPATENDSNAVVGLHPKIINAQALQKDKGKRPMDSSTYGFATSDVPELREMENTPTTFQHTIGINERGGKKIRPEPFQMDNWNFLYLDPEIQRGKRGEDLILKDSFKDLKVARKRRIYKSESKPFWFKLTGSFTRMSEEMEMIEEKACSFSHYYVDNSEKLFEIISNLESRRISIESYAIFSDIIENLTKKMYAKLPEKKNKPYSRKQSMARLNGKIPTRAVMSKDKIDVQILRYIKETTKISTFLIVAYQCLLGGNEKKVLTAHLVDEILQNLKEVWDKIDANDLKLTEEYKWAKYNSRILSISQTPRNFFFRNELVYKLGVEFAKYWVRTYGQVFEGVHVNKLDSFICSEDIYFDFISQLIYISNRQHFPL